MKHNNYCWRDILTDALLCGGAALIVAGVTILWGVSNALIVAGAFSILYGIMSARSQDDGGGGA